jgi:hypothetical protein
VSMGSSARETVRSLLGSVLSGLTEKEDEA